MNASRRVLVAEDNRVNQRVAAGLIEKLGYEVDVVVDGHEVIEAVRNGEYGLILMDCEMPGMNGFEATRRLRMQASIAADLPIIALTAHAMEGDEERCLAAGMNAYLSKPLTLLALKAALDEIVAQKTAHPTNDRAAS